MKAHKQMLSEIRRGDKVVTGGGIMGTVTKVEDDEVVTVEIAPDIKVKVNRGLISTVTSKTEPQDAKKDDKKEAANDAGGGGDSGGSGGSLLGKLLGGKK